MKIYVHKYKNTPWEKSLPIVYSESGEATVHGQLNYCHLGFKRFHNDKC